MNERLWGLFVQEANWADYFLFRHQLLTYLTREGLLDAQIQRVSGHRSRESLALYQTLSLADVQPKYQDAMSRFPVR